MPGSEMLAGLTEAEHSQHPHVARVSLRTVSG
jgi:hypothetical protein